jgi:hypothetical protein
MEFIAKNHDVFNFFSDRKSILNGQLLSFYIWNSEEKVNCELKIDISSENRIEIITIRFLAIEEYSFYYKNIYYFYNIYNLKFFFDKGISKFYLSLDPCDELEQISIEDQDFILAEDIELFLSSKVFST